MPPLCQPGAEPIPGHRLIARLGGGGFGEVWKCACADGVLKAIKIVHGDLAAAGDRTAEQELRGHRRVCDLRHPCLLALERIDVIDGQLIITMELAECSLWDHCAARRGIAREDLLRYLGDAAAALDFLAAAQLQHLDVKPQNLLLMSDRLKLGDFGLVRDLRSGRPSAAASPAYSAPETFAGRLSPHCDQYSLAVVYQELLAGTRPFAGMTAKQLAVQHLTDSPNLSPLPADDRAIVERALSKKPEERFASCTDFVRALRVGWVEEPKATKAHQSKCGGPSSPSAPRPTLPRITMPSVVIGVGGAGGAVLRRLRRSLAERLGPADGWPVRLLYINTDPEAIRAVVEDGSLEPSEVLPARLQRADHYARLRPGWFDPAWLERLASTDSPRGCRGLGGLAFAEHVRALGQKIEADLAKVGRVNAAVPPRVVIVAGIAGGTGGMAIDLAYLARHLLRGFGNAPDVSGWLLLPATDADDRAIANAFATLAELKHYAKPDTTYRARCDEPSDSLTSKDAPFTEVVALPFDAATAADGLLRGLTSVAVSPGGAAVNSRGWSAAQPPGPCLDSVAPEGRSKFVTPGTVASPGLRDVSVPIQGLTPLAIDGRPFGAGAGGACHTFGQTRLAWPRRAIVRHAARRLATDLLERWTKADTAAMENRVRPWVAEQWTALELGPEALAIRLQQAVAAPSPSNETTDGLIREWGTRLARPAVTLIEHPAFRLAGAEMAVRLLTERVERSLAYAETVAAKHQHPALLRQVAAVYTALRGQLADQLAEIGLCRTHLAAVADALRADDVLQEATGELLLPPGCNSVADAAGGLGIGIEDFRQLEQKAQQHLTDTLGGLARACLTATDLPLTLGSALVEMAESVIKPRLADNGATAAFLARHPEPLSALMEMWNAAIPALAPSESGETTLIAPDSLADLARQALGDDVTIIPSDDEIAVVRTVPRLPLTALPQFGPAAKAAYQRRKAAGESPHSRIDVPFGE